MPFCISEWADELTDVNRGKHFIGDFLPPDELERFMETYKVGLNTVKYSCHIPLAIQI